MKHVLILASALSMAVAASAAEVIWTASADGYWEVQSTWKDSTPPVALDRVYIYPDYLADNTVTNSLKLQGDLDFALGALHIRSDRTRNWALDCNGHKFTTPALSEGSYEDNPFIFVPYGTKPLTDRAVFCINGNSSGSHTGDHSCSKCY